MIPVSRLVVSTETHGMTPHDSSVTVPDMVAVVSWAKEIPHKRTMRQKLTTAVRDILSPLFMEQMKHLWMKAFTFLQSIISFPQR